MVIRALALSGAPIQRSTSRTTSGLNIWSKSSASSRRPESCATGDTATSGSALSIAWVVARSPAMSSPSDLVEVRNVLHPPVAAALLQPERSAEHQLDQRLQVLTAFLAGAQVLSGDAGQVDDRSTALGQRRLVECPVNEAAKPYRRTAAFAGRIVAQRQQFIHPDSQQFDERPPLGPGVGPEDGGGPQSWPSSAMSFARRSSMSRSMTVSEDERIGG